MSTTRTWNDLLAAAGHAYPRAIDDLKLEYIVNNALAKMWNAFDWRGTTAPFMPFWLVPGDQDYGAPFYSVPSDFGRILYANLSYVNSFPPVKYPPLAVVSNLEVTHVQRQPTSIAYKPEIAGFRLHPVAPPSYASPNWLVEGAYKKRPPKVTRDLLGELVLWDDQYFDALTQAYIWAAVRAQPNRQLQEDQERIFRIALAEALQHEDFEQGSPIIHPSEGLSESNQIGFDGLII